MPLGDLIPADNTSTEVIQMGGTYDGALETHDDLDWIKVVITEPGRYKFTLSVSDGDLNDGYLTLFNSAGGQVTFSDSGGGGEDDVIELDLQAGTYFLQAAAMGGINSATYHLTASVVDVPGDTSSTVTIAVDGTYSGTLENYGDVDWLKFDVSEAGSYVFTLSVNGDYYDEAYLSLYSSTGTYLKNGENDYYYSYGEDRLGSELQAGTYFVAVSASAYGEATSATYDLTATKIVDVIGSAATTATITVDGSSVSGTFNFENDRDWYRFEIAQDGNYEFFVSGSGWDNSATIRNAQGTSIQTFYEDNDPEYNTFSLTAGTYYLDPYAWTDMEFYQTSYTLWITTALPDNTAPEVSGDVSLTGVLEGVAAQFTVAELLANASDVDLDQLVIQNDEVLVKDGNDNIIGTADYDAGTYTVTLNNSDYNGLVVLDYVISDGTDTVAGSATYEVTAVNDAPTFSGEITLDDVAEGTDGVFTVAELLANADDVDAGDVLSIVGNAVLVEDSKGGTIGTATYNDGKFTVTLDNEDYNGDVYLSYLVSDGTDTVAGSATYEVTPVNDAPTWSGPLSLTGVDEGEDATFTVSELLANAVDVDSQAYIYSDSITAKNGNGDTIGTGNIDGKGFTFHLEDADYNGTVYFEYTIGDGEYSTTASASYEVAPVNDEVTGTAATISDTDEDTPFSLTKADLLANISDVEDADEDLTITIGTVVGGTFVYNATTQAYDFTPTANYHGPASITYTVSDTDGDSHEVISSFDIISVNDAGPALTGEQAELDFGTMNKTYTLTEVDLLQGFTDVDGDELSISGAVTADHGTVVDNQDGTYTFTPATGYIGRVTFSFAVSDGIADAVPASNQTFVLSDTDLLTTTYNPLSEGAVNTVTAGEQSASSVAYLTGGGYVVTWMGTDLVGSTASIGVKAQRFDADGVKVGSEFQVNTTNVQTQYQPTITGLANGGYVIAWSSNLQDGSSYGVYLKQYAADGTVTLAETKVNTHTGSEQHQPTITAFSDGSYMVSWASSSINTGDGSSFGIAAQRFNANGTASGTEFRINTYTVGDQQSPAITALADNSFVVTWHSTGQEGSGLGYGIYAQRYNSAGVAQGGEVHVNTSTAGNQRFPATAALEDGGYVIAWQDSATTDVHFQRYNASGVAQGSQTVANSGATSGTQTDPAIAALSTGGFVIVWTSASGDGSGSGIYAQRFTATGVADGDVILVNTTTTGDQVAASVTTLTNGSIVVTWTSADAAGNGIFQKIIEANTQPYLGDAQADLTSGSEDTPFTISTATLLQGVMDDEGHDLTITSLIGDDFSAVYDAQADAWTITPSANFSGTLTLNYTVSDGHNGTLNLTQTVAVTAVNDAPVIGDSLDTTAIEGGQSVVIDALSNASDVEGSNLTVIPDDELPAGVSFAGTSFTFDPTDAAYDYLAVGEITQVVIDYEISDGTTTTDASITITVTGTNDAPTFGYSQSFESDTSGLYDSFGGSATRVMSHVSPSGTIGAASGGYFAVLTESDGAGPFTRFDGYRSDFVDGLTTNVKVYLDTAWADGEGFNYTVAANGSDGTFERDFGFHFVKDASEGQLLVNVDHFGGSQLTDDLETKDGTVAITESGWYTLEHVFNNVEGVLSVDLRVIASDGTVVFSKTLSELEDVIPANVGGNRYGWFADISIAGGLAVDQVSLGDDSGTVTEDEGPFQASGPNDGFISTPVSDTLETSGVIPFSDVDLSDEHSVSVIAGNMIGSPLEYYGDLTATVTTDSTDTGRGLVTWTFTVANEDVQFLGAGQTLTQTYFVTLSDGESGSATREITVTIVGTNDDPVLSGTQATLDGGTEDETYIVNAADLLEGFSDVDTSDELSVANLTASDGATVVDNLDGTYTVTHANNFNGTITLSYDVVDGEGGSVAATQSYTVDAVNDAPLAGYDTAGNTTPEETAVTYDVSDLISDVDLDNLDGLTITAEVDPAQGTVTVEGKIITFTPATNFVGTAIITYTVSDGTLSNTGEVWYNVTNENDAPTAENDTVSGTEETLQVIDVADLIGDVDANETLTITATSPNGTVTVDGTQLSFTPASNFYGTATITYTVSDGETSTDGTITVNVANTYDAPTINPDGGEIDDMLEDTTINLRVSDFLNGVINPDNATLTASEVFASEGVITQTTPGNYRYTPPADYYGEVTINFTLSDGTTDVISEIKFYVTNVNDKPIAPVNPGSLGTTDEDVAFTGSDADLLEGWYDVDFERDEEGDLPDLVVSDISVSGGGTVDRDGGSFTINMPQDFNGTATITYTVFDGVAYVQHTRSLTVTPVADAPVIDEDEAADLTGAVEDTDFFISTADLLQGVSDPDGTSSFTITAIAFSSGTYAPAEGGYTYSPAADDNGSVTITYTVSDGVNSTQMTNTFQVAAVNDAPRGTAADITGVMEDTVASFTKAQLLDNIYDIDGGSLNNSIMGTSFPLEITDIEATGGTIVWNSTTQQYDFTPTENYYGEASITYTVSDGIDSEEFTSTFEIEAINDDPAGDAATITGVSEDTLKIITRAELLANVTDVDNDAEDFVITGLSAVDGTFTYNAMTENYEFQPTHNVFGPTSITYTVQDGNGGSKEYTSTFQIAGVNDDPTAPATIDLGSANEDSTIIFDVADLLAGWTDVDGDEFFTVSDLSAGDGFTVTLSEDETYYTVTTPADFVGEIVFEYKVNDGHGGSEFGSATLEVTNVYDAPELDGPASLTAIDEDTTTTVSAADLLQGWTSADSLDLSLGTVTATNATVTELNGVYTITPTANFHGTVTLNYTIVDGEGEPVAASLDLTVNSVIDLVTSDTTTTLGATDEKLVLTGEDDIDGTGNSLNNELVGNDGANKLDGKAGADTMYGGGNDDIYIVDNIGDVASEESTPGTNDGGFDMVRSSVSYTLGNYIEVLRLTGSGNTNATGNSQSNFLYGNSGNNALDGSYGGDIMEGGLGNDTYYVNVATDEVVEALNAGIDTVVSQISYTLSDNLENVTLASWGTAAINATGNATANVITGGRGSNVLSGMAGNDTITGDAGNDTIDGGLGADVMYGGAGSDNYYINDIGDTVSEETVSGVNDGGIDTVFASVSHSLGTFFERLTLEGFGDINGTGNTQNNLITGNSGNNTLDGGVGADTISGGAGNDRIIGGTSADNLTGGEGADTFVFARTGGGTDRVMDFQVGLDHLAFVAADFGFTAGHNLTDAQFTSNGTGTAIGTTGQFVYNTTTSTLVWDSNGTGSGGVTTLAIFDNGAALTKADFVFEGLIV